MKMNLGINIIPDAIWDINLRKIASLVIYNIFTLANMINEPDIVKKSLIMDLGLKNKKYYPFKYIYLQKEEEAESKDKKDKGKKPPEAKKEDTPEQTNPEKPQEPKFKEIPNSVLRDLEKECQEIVEFIYSCGDYNELIKAKLDIYKDILDSLIEKYNGVPSTSAKDKKENKPQNPTEGDQPKEFYPNLQNDIEKHKLNINDIIEVWDGFKAEGIKFIQKYLTSGATKEKYYQFLDKMLKKLIQNFIGGLFASSGIVDQKDKKAAGGGASGAAGFSEILALVDSLQIKKEDHEFIINIYNQKLQFISGDILYKLKVRIRDYLTTIKAEMPQDGTGQDIDLEKMGGQIEEKFFGCIVEEEIKPP
jgi:hypothetical protein